MYYDRNSEDLDLPNFNFNLDNQKPVKKKETIDNKKKKIFIVISIVVGTVVLAIIIFLVIYLSNRKKDDGGIIYATHEIDSINPFIIINNDNLDENDIEINIKMNDTILLRLLHETSYTIEKNIFKFHSEQKIEGRIIFEIKFNKKISSMSGMFQNIKNLVSVDLSEFKSEKVKNMNSIFAECTKLENINFSNFNSKNVENMNNIFENCRELIEIDLSSFKTPKLKSMKSAFKNCFNLFSLNLTNFIINNVDITDIFDNAKNLYFILIKDKNTKDIIDSKTMNNTFDIENCIKGDGEKCKDCKEKENEQYKCNSCNYGYYIPKNLINPIKCKKCYKNCKSCFGEYMNCTECEEGFEYIIDKNKCVKISSLTDQEFTFTDTFTDFNFLEDLTNEINDEDENIEILSDQ